MLLVELANLAQVDKAGREKSKKQHGWVQMFLGSSSLLSSFSPSSSFVRILWEKKDEKKRRPSNQGGGQRLR